MHNLTSIGYQVEEEKEDRRLGDVVYKLGFVYIWMKYVGTIYPYSMHHIRLSCFYVLYYKDVIFQVQNKFSVPCSIQVKKKQYLP